MYRCGVRVQAQLTVHAHCRPTCRPEPPFVPMQVLLNVLADEIHRAHQRCTTAEGCDPNLCKMDLVLQAGAASMQLLQGAYSCICLIGGVGLVAFRDPYGIRWGLASHNTGLQLETDPQPFCSRVRLGGLCTLKAWAWRLQGSCGQHTGTASDCVCAVARLLSGTNLRLWARLLSCGDLLWWVGLSVSSKEPYVIRKPCQGELAMLTWALWPSCFPAAAVSRLQSLSAAAKHNPAAPVCLS